jgi:hypothetical protein
MVLNQYEYEAAGQRKEHWESKLKSQSGLDIPFIATNTYCVVLRTKHVPRFLFRAFNNQSGGGPLLATNNTTEVVPRGFMNSSGRHRFYDTRGRSIQDRKLPLLEHIRFPHIV